MSYYEHTEAIKEMMYSYEEQKYRKLLCFLNEWLDGRKEIYSFVQFKNIPYIWFNDPERNFSLVKKYAKEFEKEFYLKRYDHFDIFNFLKTVLGKIGYVLKKKKIDNKTVLCIEFRKTY